MAYQDVIYAEESFHTVEAPGDEPALYFNQTKRVELIFEPEEQEDLPDKPGNTWGQPDDHALFVKLARVNGRSVAVGKCHNGDGFMLINDAGKKFRYPNSYGNNCVEIRVSPAGTFWVYVLRVVGPDAHFQRWEFDGNLNLLKRAEIDAIAPGPPASGFRDINDDGSPSYIFLDPGVVLGTHLFTTWRKRGSITVGGMNDYHPGVGIFDDRRQDAYDLFNGNIQTPPMVAYAPNGQYMVGVSTSPIATFLSAANEQPWPDTGNPPPDPNPTPTPGVSEGEQNILAKLDQLDTKYTNVCAQMIEAQMALARNVQEDFATVFTQLDLLKQQMSALGHAFSEFNQKYDRGYTGHAKGRVALNLNLDVVLAPAPPQE